jgi:tetratricopeptide (TPR) repeat protein
MNRKRRHTGSKPGNRAVPVDATALQVVFANAIHHHQSGRLNEAELLYRRVLAASPGHDGTIHLLGMVACQTGRHALAVALISKAISINANIAKYHCNLGNALWHQGRLSEAAACCRDALHLLPDLPEAHNNLGLVLRDQGRSDAAIECYREALRLNPDFPEAHNNLGVMLRDQGQLDEALVCQHRALELRPEFPEAHNNLGNVLRDQGWLDGAVASYRTALDLAPDLPDGHFNLALALLSRGDMAAGWREHEWRWKTPQMIGDRRDFSQPRWRGEAAEGRTLLIHAEQGYGDTLQFCRYARLAAANGLRVIMEVQKPLVRLLNGVPGVDLVVATGEQLPEFNLHCPMLSMPLAFGTTVATIPGAADYLSADEAISATWRARLAAMPNRGRRIGLVWAGDSRSYSPSLAAQDRRRSLAPDQLTPLFEVSGLHFFSLQKIGAKPPDDLPLTDFMDEMTDFADTAALVANLDLVISVDTAVAHLAAALGKPVWLLDRFDSCWRWLTGRRDSPWYPTLRIYRQPHAGDWDSVLAEVVRDLRDIAGQPSSVN